MPVFTTKDLQPGGKLYARLMASKATTSNESSKPGSTDANHQPSLKLQDGVIDGDQDLIYETEKELSDDEYEEMDQFGNVTVHKGVVPSESEIIQGVESDPRFKQIHENRRRRFLNIIEEVEASARQNNPDRESAVDMSRYRFVDESTKYFWEVDPYGDYIGEEIDRNGNLTNQRKLTLSERRAMDNTIDCAMIDATESNEATEDERRKVLRSGRVLDS